MINEEAIKILKTLIPKTCKMVDGRLKGGFDDTDSSEYKAIQMAINALEKHIPKKVKDKEVIRTDNYRDGSNMTRWNWWCPSCYLEKNVNRIKILS